MRGTNSHSHISRVCVCTTLIDFYSTLLIINEALDRTIQYVTNILHHHTRKPHTTMMTIPKKNVLAHTRDDRTSHETAMKLKSLAYEYVIVYDCTSVVVVYLVVRPYHHLQHNNTCRLK